MHDRILWNDFKSGWCPSDDPINGRRNAFQRMNNVELDANGAVQLIGGTAVKWTGFPANSHTMFTRVMNGTRRDYTALTDGSIYRDQTSIGSGGDATNAAFGTAFKYTLAASGTKRIKDDGATAVNLGVLPPTAAIVTQVLTAQKPATLIGDLISHTVTPVGTSAVVGFYLQMTANGTGNVATQTYAGVGDPKNPSKLTGSGGDVGYGLDSDTIEITGYTPSPIGKTLQIAVLLAASNVAGDLVSDYYAFDADLGTATFDPTTGTFTLIIRRDAFTRVGVGSQDWSTTYGFRITYKGAAGDVINILGSNTAGLVYITGGSNAQNGTYQYMQVNVNNTGSYQAKSPIGVLTGTVDSFNNQVAFVAQNPTAIDAQVNEVWIYRKGGLLETWYRIKVIPIASIASAFFDTLSDIAALDLNIKFNDKLVSIASTGISEKILSIVGPINGRWYYFTANFMYPSDINNPDLVDATIAVRTTNSNSEIFLWAKEVSEGVVLVGTSVGVYILTGTFQTFPDFTIDIYYRGLACKYPPISYDADVFNNEVVYLANDGWRTISAGGENRILVAPNTDLLYRNISRAGYTPINLKITPGSVRFPVCIGKNKLWCFMTGTNRCEVYDFVRQYWRTFFYNLGDATTCAATQDGQIIAFYGTDKKIREIDLNSSKLIDGATRQTATMLSPVFDNDTPKQRKDSATLKVRLYTGAGGLFSVYLITDNGVTTAISTTIQSTSRVTEVLLDLAGVPAVALVKTYQLLLTGAIDDLTFVDAEILFQTRPPQASFTKIYNDNFGNANRKRVRVWPMVIDTLGNIVTWTPYVDNVAGISTLLTTTNKDTKRLFYITDVSGVDYGGVLSGGVHEFFGMLQPDIVQTFPIARRFDQVGPEEFFRYGKIKQIELRVLPVGGTSIPYTIYFNDQTSKVGSFNVTSGVEATYFIMMPKGVAGNIVRIEIGPTSFDFHRFYMRLQVAESGNDTDLRWINI